MWPSCPDTAESVPPSPRAAGGIAISVSGRLAGPWTQQAEPLYANDGGHGMLFTTFDGRLMMVLHSPNGPAARPHLFEMQDTGDTLKIVNEFTGMTP